MWCPLVLREIKIDSKLIISGCCAGFRDHTRSNFLELFPSQFSLGQEEFSLGLQENVFSTAGLFLSKEPERLSVFLAPVSLSKGTQWAIAGITIFCLHLTTNETHS